MNNDKSRNTILAIAGGYLIYLGISLIGDAIKSEFADGVLPIIFGVFFIVVGAIVLYVKGKVILSKTEESNDVDAVVDVENIAVETTEITDLKGVEEVEKSEEVEDVEDVEEVEDVDSI